MAMLYSEAQKASQRYLEFIRKTTGLPPECTAYGKMLISYFDQPNATAVDVEREKQGREHAEQNLYDARACIERIEKALEIFNVPIT